ncbi:MAG: DUF4142 domain-containing protein [Bacteroidota bacterium]
MKNKLVIAVFLSFMLLLSACQRKTADEQNPDAAAGDSVSANNNQIQNEFVSMAASGGMMEVELGRLASQKARSADVKDFAQKMITDHSNANDELKVLAKGKNIAVPDSMMDEHRGKVEDMSKVKAENFDKEYMSMMVEDHEKDIKEFEDAAQNNQDPDVKQWAGKTVVKLRNHLTMAKKIHDRLK